MVKYYVPTWEEIEDGLLEIAYKLVKDDYIPDTLALIMTGGMIPAKLLSDLLGVKDFAYLDIRSYNVTSKAEPVLRGVIASELSQKRVLLVDDVSDTGETLELAERVISLFKPKEVRTATIYIKPWTKKIPNYYYKSVDSWIVFPWDKWEVYRSNRDINLRNAEKYRLIEEKIVRR